MHFYNIGRYFNPNKDLPVIFVPNHDQYINNNHITT